MADKTARLLASVLQPQREVYNYTLSFSFASVAAEAANGDRIQLCTIQQAHRLFQSYLRASATLGANCTLKLQRDRAGVYTDLTAATTAGGASLVSGILVGPLDLLPGDILVLLVGGADIAAVATVEVDALVMTK